MSAKEKDLFVARIKLISVLGDNALVYFTHIKYWFQLKINKDAFEAQVRMLLKRDQMHYHDEFLLAMLNEVGGMKETSVSEAYVKVFEGSNITELMEPAEAPEPQAGCSVVTTFDRQVIPGSKTVEPLEPAKIKLKESESTHAEEAADFIDKSHKAAGVVVKQEVPADGCEIVTFCREGRFLPNKALIMGRFILAAWENDMDEVEDNAFSIMMEATKTLLKNVITAIVSQCKPFKKKMFRNTQIPIGCEPGEILEDPPQAVFDREALESQFRQAVEEALEPRHLQKLCPIDEAKPPSMNEACSSRKRKENGKVHLNDIYDALLSNRNIVGSHAVYSRVIKSI